MGVLAAHLVDAKGARPHKARSLAYDVHWAAVVMAGIRANNVVKILDGSNIVRTTERLLHPVKQLHGVLGEGRGTEKQNQPKEQNSGA